MDGWTPDQSKAAVEQLNKQAQQDALKAMQDRQKAQMGMGGMGGTPYGGMGDAFSALSNVPDQATKIGATWTDEMAKAYAERQRKRFAEELPFAEQYLAGMESGELSQALQAQKLGMGQTAAQQAMMGAQNNPMAARQAMFAGGQAALDVAGKGAEARGQEIGGALDQALQAQVRQSAYEQQLRGILGERERMTKMAQLQAQQQKIQAEQQQTQIQQKAIGSIFGGAAAGVQQYQTATASSGKK